MKNKLIYIYLKKRKIEINWLNYKNDLTLDAVILLE